MPNLGIRAQFFGYERKHWSETNQLLEESKKTQTLISKKEHIYGIVSRIASTRDPKLEIINNFKSISLFYHRR